MWNDHTSPPHPSISFSLSLSLHRVSTNNQQQQQELISPSSCLILSAIGSRQCIVAPPNNAPIHTDTSYYIDALPLFFFSFLFLYSPPHIGAVCWRDMSCRHVRTHIHAREALPGLLSNMFPDWMACRSLKTMNETTKKRKREKERERII